MFIHLKSWILALGKSLVQAFAQLGGLADMGVALVHQHPVDAVALLPTRVLLVRVAVALLTFRTHSEL